MMLAHGEICVSTEGMLWQWAVKIRWETVFVIIGILKMLYVIIAERIYDVVEYVWLSLQKCFAEDFHHYSCMKI